MPIPRKVLIRVVGAPLLLAALAGLLYWDHRAGSPAVLRWLLAAVAALAVWEVYAMAAAKGIATARVAGTVCTAGLFIPWGQVRFKARPPAGPYEFQGSTLWVHDVWIGFSAALLIVFVLLMYVLLKLVFRFGRFTPEGAGLTLLGFAYVGLLALLLAAPVDAGAEIYYLLFLLACGKGSDMAAFVAGKTLGKHKMAPVVSPHKTWEGGVAGGLAGTGAGLAVILLTPLRASYAAAPVPALLFFAVLVTIAAQVGDLVKSAFKRWAGVKDSGRLLPEFGGMLDMVDSFLVGVPVAHLGTVLLQAVFKGA
jgi:CDP-diglyceride synthetase